MLLISLRRICQSLSAAISDDVKRVSLALRMLRYVLHFHQSSDALTVRPRCGSQCFQEPNLGPWSSRWSLGDLKWSNRNNQMGYAEYFNVCRACSVSLVTRAKMSDMGRII